MIQAIAPNLIEIDDDTFETTDWRKLTVSGFFERTDSERRNNERGTRVGYAVFVLTVDGAFFHVSDVFDARSDAKADHEAISAAWADAKWMAHPKYRVESTAQVPA